MRNYQSWLVKEFHDTSLILLVSHFRLTGFTMKFMRFLIQNFSFVPFSFVQFLRQPAHFSIFLLQKFKKKKKLKLKQQKQYLRLVFSTHKHSWSFVTISQLLRRSIVFVNIPKCIESFFSKIQLRKQSIFLSLASTL